MIVKNPRSNLLMHEERSKDIFIKRKQAMSNIINISNQR